ncbi:MAG: FAD-dependent oxidoreductase [Adlercreutzia sp.]|nr:FAD-dependent oxidoreductase [Adlercreutzia sp.]
MDRRTFLSTALIAGSATALAGLAGCAPATSGSAVGDEAGSGNESGLRTAQTGPQEKTVDIAIVGAGGSGLCAALTAQAGGASVCLIEAMPMTGGATIGSTATNICGSRMQRDAGIEDGPEQILASYVDDIENPYVLETAEMYANNNGETYDWLIDEIGAQMQDEVQYFAPYPVARIVYPIGGGQGTVDALTAKVAETDIDLMLDTVATEIIREDGTVTGLVVETSDGAQCRINAKAVILAAGGFAGNENMIPRDVYETGVYYGTASSDGKSVPMALVAGCQLLDLGCVPLEGGGLEVSPGIGIQLFSPVMAAYGGASGIMVGPDGNRVVNELSGAPALVPVYKALPDATAYLFMDNATFKVFYGAGTREVGGAFTAETFEKWVAADGKELPLIVKADTIEEAAAKAGIDAAGLQATIDAWNADAEGGMDSQFKRPIKAPIGDGPYCVVKQNLRYAHTFGGLVANGQLQVLDWANEPIPGLYAAGQMLRSFQGNTSKPSSSTSFAYTSGRQAAVSALKTL